MEKVQAILLLEDGKIFYGKAAGMIGTAVGELCFNTGMTGYQEVFTDPSYYSQILTTTHVHIGNYGVEDNESESDGVKIAGLVCRTFNEIPSRKRANGSLQDYFIKNKIVAISEVDTRALVRHLRNRGSMNGIVSSQISDVNQLKKLLEKALSMTGLELSSKVTGTKPNDEGNPASEMRVALLDLGYKRHIATCLTERNCLVRIFPMGTSFEEIMKWNPNGFLISNGPGDPSAMTDEIKNVAMIITSGLPVMGICLGHQLIALANGISTYKMHNGHRGINHPVKNLETGKCEITSQNHGFAVSEQELAKSKNTKITHVNLNDGTIEGIRLTDYPVFSVQYHPEAAPGPLDARYLFDDFVKSVKDSLVRTSRKSNQVSQ